MLRVLSPMGKLFEASSVVPVTEKVIEFNGRRKKLCEKAQGLAQKPTGIVFYPRTGSGGLMMVSNIGLYVGNMRPEKVQSLMKEMLERGYCDLSTMEYQPSKRGHTPIIDGGESPAYSSETTPGSFPLELNSMCGFGGINGLGGMDVCNCSESDDDEFFDGDDGEDS